MTIETASYNGAACWCDVARVYGTVDTIAGAREIAMLSLYGPRVSVRALWARLVGRSTKDRFGCSIDITGMGKVEIGVEDRPITIAAALPNNGWHAVLVAPGSTTQWPADKPQFVHIGEGGSAAWVRRLGFHSGLPLRPDWGPWLWAKGVEGKHVRPLVGFGPDVAEVDTDVEAWHTLVREGLASMELI